MTAQTLDEVIQRLDAIIATAIAEKSRMGYFAALYRKVTIKVKKAIEAGEFDDNARMERLDVAFANRYLEAYDAYRDGNPVSASWRVAFDACNSRRPIVLQHLLLGMNAHINLDLGIAAAQAGGGGDFSNLKDDFNKINEILASLVEEVKDELGKIWPPLRFLDWIAGKADDAIIDFSMEKARDHAWGHAETLAGLDPAGRAAHITEMDADTAFWGRLIRFPGIIAWVVAWWIRNRERGTVPEIIEILK